MQELKTIKEIMKIQNGSNFNNDLVNKMTFEGLKAKYAGREAAFPKNSPGPTEEDLKSIIATYNCKFPNSFIKFQLKYCHQIPMVGFAFDGFGFANKSLDPYMNLEEVIRDFQELNPPDYLSPFRQDNGDFWCFDNRSKEPESTVVVWDHHSNQIEQDPSYQWKNFLDWLDKTMDDEY